jgi:biopolymer transport protein ExbD
MATKGRVKHSMVSELNLIPFMNLMSTLIPFLLVTAVFTSIAIIDINLPASSPGGPQKQEEQPEKKDQGLVLTVLISDQGITVGARGGFLPSVLKEGGKYDFIKVGEQLAKIKQQFPDKEEIIITSEPNIIYDVIIKAMDKCRENGFPNISIGAIQ